MLSFHLYYHAQYSDTRAQNNRTMLVNHKNRAVIRQGEQQQSKHEQDKDEEEVIMLPVEDVINVSFKADFTKKHRC